VPYNFDSIRILPGAKLAKDWKVSTHFPHYFFLNDIQTTLQYIGVIPEYKFFEPTSRKDYEAMLIEFSNSVDLFQFFSKHVTIYLC